MQHEERLRNLLIGDIMNEAVRQTTVWGIQNHPSLDKLLINRKGGSSAQRMTEEYEIPSEARAKFLCNTAAERQQLTWAHIAIEELSEAISEFDPVKRREELVQLGAVIINWIDSIDRNEIKQP